VRKILYVIHVVHRSSMIRWQIRRPHGGRTTSMPKRPIPSSRWCASTKARCNSSVRSVSQSRPGRVSSNVTITSIVAMVRSISSFSSTFIVPGARSKSPSGERQKTTPDACAISSTSIIPMPRSSGSCRIIYRPTRPAPCIRRSRPPKPGGSCDGPSSTTPPKHASWLNMVEERDRRPARSVPGS
jgi:hypothetical protein